MSNPNQSRAGRPTTSAAVRHVRRASTFARLSATTIRTRQIPTRLRKPYGISVRLSASACAGASCTAYAAYEASRIWVSLAATAA